jgi:hypothetical protein
MVSEDKAYSIVDKLEKFGEKLGLRVNHKLTLLGKIMGVVAVVGIFGTAALFRAFFKNVGKK